MLWFNHYILTTLDKVMFAVNKRCSAHCEASILHFVCAYVCACACSGSGEVSGAMPPAK